MNHAQQPAGAGHVDAVVVPRAQVEGGVVAVLKVRGQPLVATHQRRGAVAVALGLEDLIALDGTELADGAVHRAQQVGTGRERARAADQRAREEFVEAAVGRGVGLHRFEQVDAVVTREPLDDGCRGRPTLGARERAHQVRQCLLGQQVLQRDGDTLSQGRLRRIISTAALHLRRAHLSGAISRKARTTPEPIAAPKRLANRSATLSRGV